MPKKKIKHTKNELKTQRDALRRFERYLPTLQLKKQQLQLEVRQCETAIRTKEEEQEALRRDLSDWLQLFAEPFEFAEYLKVEEIIRASGNIAGVNIPILKEVVFKSTVPDLFATPAWVDDGSRMIEKLIHLRLELEVLHEQHRLLAEELRVTNQRVNLFEKVKIPETREHIRVIRVFLGDQQTAEVSRAKIAKGKTSARENAA